MARLGLDRPEQQRTASGESLGQQLLAAFSPVVWICLAVLAAVVYGVVNDQVTISLSPEYFTVFKRHQFGLLLESLGLGEAAPRVQAIAIGTAATWWFGLLLGLMVAVAGTWGRSPRLTTRQFLRAVGLVMLVTLGTSLVFGAVGYVRAPGLPGIGTEAAARYWPFLDGIREQRAAFGVGCWHDGAYLGGLVGTIIACWRVWRWRRGYGLKPNRRADT